MNRNEDDAKDVVQATLVKAMRKLGDYRGEAAMFTWLCQICRREIASHVRSERRYSDKVVLIEDSEEVRAALESIEAPAADDPLRRCDGAELKRLVHAVLDRLPGRYGEALEWKYVEGRSVRKSATGWESAIPPRSRCWRARGWRFGTGSKQCSAHRPPTCLRASRPDGGNMSEDQQSYDRDEAALARLVAAVGPRQQPSAAATSEVRAAVEAEWRRTVDARQQRRRVPAWAMAAAGALLRSPWLARPSTCQKRRP